MDIFGPAKESLLFYFAGVMVITAHPISSQVTLSRVIVIIITSIVCLTIAVCLAMIPWNSTPSNFLFKDRNFTYDAIDHATIPRISGSKKYITQLPRLNQIVVGRDDKVKEIIHNIMNLNHNIMIVGKPGFGKST